MVSISFENDLQSIGLLDAPCEEPFDNITRLAAAVFDAPTSLISIVDFESDRQFFKSAVGLGAPWDARRQTPLSHSFCQHVVRGRTTLNISDAREHPMVSRNLAIRDLNVIAYLGAPISLPNGVVVGALCVIDSRPRRWSATQAEILDKFSRCIADSIRLNAMRRASEILRRQQQSFAYAMSHDLKAPANTVRMLLKELRLELAKPLDDTTETILDHCETRIDRMSALVDGVLDYANHVHVDAEKGFVDTMALLDGVLADLGSSIAAANAVIEREPLPPLYGSDLQIRILFQNLIANALKFRRPGTTPRISIAGRACPGGGADVISVRDNGIGIETDYHQKIFDPFERLHSAEAYEGVGLGLSLCARIVAGHQGRIEVESEPGRGAEFRVTLPRGSING